MKNDSREMGCEQLSSVSKLHALLTQPSAPVLLPNARFRLRKITLLIGQVDGVTDAASVTPADILTI